jgi:sugar lactone lactonase YvrE
VPSPLVRRALPPLASILLLLAACGSETPAIETDAAAPPPTTAPVSTAATRILVEIGDSASRIEGIAAHAGQLYVTDWKDGSVYRIDPAADAPSAVKVGAVPTKPGDAILGLATNATGDLFVAVPGSGIVYRIAAARLGARDFDAAKDATAFATGAAGANGLAFDATGHLWISGGDQGALYHVGPQGGAATVFAKDYAAVGSDTTMPVRAYVVNGAAFDSQGFIYTANTGTGEITRLEIKPDYTLGAVTRVVQDDRLIGADGLRMAPGDTLWVTANFRNTLAKVAPGGAVTIVAQDAMAGGALRFPAEFVLLGGSVYVANLNFPIGSNAGSAPGATVAAVEPN